jgi:type VI secretion system protein ImpK
MPGWTRSLGEHLRQRGHHPAFRIGRPAWDEHQRRRLESLLDELAAAESPGAAPGEPPTRRAADAMNSLAASLTTAEAAALARAGDLAGAATVLSTGPAGPAELDLLARLHAQRGDLEAADLCWARVQATHPEHSGAAAGRATIEAIRARRRLPRPLLRPSWVAVGAVVVAGLVILGGSFADDPAANIGPAPQSSTRLTELEQQLAAQETAAARHEAALNATAELVAQPGVTVRTTPDAVEVRFPGGLYRTGDQLTAEGRQRLRQLGATLVRADATITVVGWTVAVPGGPPAGGSPVAWSRARAAARELATASGLPLTRFTLASGDQGAPPFPDPASNRTVTLRISPAR